MTVKSKEFTDNDGRNVLLVWTQNNAGKWYRYVFETSSDWRAMLVDRVRVTWGKHGSEMKYTEVVERRVTDPVAHEVSERGYTPLLS